MNYVTVVLVGIAFALAGCGGGQQTHLDTSPGAYPAGLQGGLLGSCSTNADTDGGLPANYCQCALSQLEQNVPASQVGDPVVAGESMVKDPDIRQTCGAK